MVENSTFPAGDTDLRDFTIGRYQDTRDGWWQIFSSCGLDESSYEKDNGPEPQVGWSYRVYAWEGIERGINVNGVWVRPYQTTGEQLDASRKKLDRESSARDAFYAELKAKQRHA